MWRGGAGPVDLNPKTGDWPGLPFYVTLALQVLYGLAYRATHPGLTAQEFARHVEVDPASMMLVARLFGALIGVLSVLLTYRLGRRVAGEGAGWIAAALVAFNPAHILASQRVADPNLLSLLFLLLAVLSLTESPGWRAAAKAGAMIGLAGACKYVPLAAAVLIPLAHGGRAARGLPRFEIAWGTVGVGLAATAIAFFLASPFTLLDWGAKAQDLELQRMRLRGEWVGISESAISLPTYLVATLPQMLGWPAYLAAIAGSVLLWRSGSGGRLVALLPLVLLVPTGMLSMAQARFILPALPFLDIAAALAIARVAAWAGGATRAAHAPHLLRGGITPGVLAAALCVAWPQPDLIATRASLRLEDTRHVARRWINASIPASELMAFDVYGPAFDRERDRRPTVPWPFLATQAPLVRIAYDPLWLDGFGYYVTSSEVVGRFESASESYPREAGFYRWIREQGTPVWSTARAAASGPRIEVHALPERIGTRRARDSLWLHSEVKQIYTDRLARWCRDAATAFVLRNDLEHAEEWAARGLTIPRNQFRRELFEAQTVSSVTLGRADVGERAAAEGLRDFPGSPILHLYRGVALEALSRPNEATEEYRAALRLSPNPAAADFVRAQLSRLEGKGNP